MAVLTWVSYEQDGNDVEILSGILEPPSTPGTKKARAAKYNDIMDPNKMSDLSLGSSPERSRINPRTNKREIESKSGRTERLRLARGVAKAQDEAEKAEQEKKRADDNAKIAQMELELAALKQNTATNSSNSATPTPTSKKRKIDSDPSTKAKISKTEAKTESAQRTGSASSANIVVRC